MTRAKEADHSAPRPASERVFTRMRERAPATWQAGYLARVMPNGPPTSPRAFLVDAAIVATTALAAITTLAGCGGGAKSPKTNAVLASDAGAGAPVATSAPLGGLPPMARMPPDGVAGSKKANVRVDAALGGCSAGARTRGKDPAALLKKTTDACASVAKSKPVAEPMRGHQGDRDAHQEARFHADANHCYRVYVATDEALEDVVAVLRDSAGDVVAASSGPAVPENGAACFTAADDVTLLVGVGAGKGSWVAQVWSD